jgi:trypsin/pre-peptidase
MHRRTATRRPAGLVVLLAALALPATAPAGLVVSPRIVNGLYTSLYPTTGALLDSASFGSASIICSGTLIGCDTFLTAGHCVDGNLNPAAYSVFLQHAGFFQVASVALHPSFNFPVGDVAVLKLSTPVTGIAPTPIATTAPAFGTSGLIAGFGRSGGGSDYGLKRAGAVTTSSCASGVSDTTSVCFTFDNPVGPPGSDSDTCNGDSGGPLFVDDGSGLVVAGVTSGGDSASCQATDHSYDANVAFYASYIQAQGGADLANASCGGGPQAGGADTTIFGSIGSVDATTPQGVQSFTVPPGIGLLRIAMNAVDDGSDFDLYVKAGTPPTTTDYDCRQNGSGQFGLCEFAAPSPGTWHVLVARFAGSGTYQTTVTMFGVDCTDPGNDGRPCDDGNVCTGTDTCQAGACAGTPVSNGTPCDDGSACTTGDACHAGTCGGNALPNGTPCDDGHLCTRGDACQAGVCTAGASPATGCKAQSVPLKGIVQLKNDPFNDARDRFTWHWAAGAQTDKSEFGNPLASSGLGLCVYDETGNVPHLLMERALPVGGLWLETASGYKYNDRAAAVGGIRSVTLKSGIAGRASVVVKGQGAGIALPGLPLDQQSKVTVQLVGPNACWEARYSTHLFNLSTQFKARGD